ncbi:MAG: MotA/TolQ/ExbB proton channel family protein [Pseudomonadota bacterium]
MDWIVVVEWSARAVFLLMLALSVWSIRIIVERRRFFKLWDNLPSNSDLENQLSSGADSASLAEDPRVAFLSRVKGLAPEKIDHMFTAFCNDSRKTWSQGFQVLGTLGSTTPFIGLFGTILGIIVSFRELSEGAGQMDAVMVSLAEALLLTAAGLAVAIPAVIAFNFFNSKVESMLDDLETTKELYKAKL